MLENGESMALKNRTHIVLPAETFVEAQKMALGWSFLHLADQIINCRRAAILPFGIEGPLQTPRIVAMPCVAMCGSCFARSLSSWSLILHDFFKNGMGCPKKTTATPPEPSHEIPRARDMKVRMNREKPRPIMAPTKLTCLRRCFTFLTLSLTFFSMSRKL